MNNKEINRIIRFRKKHGHYPLYIHFALLNGRKTGGNAFTDFFTKTIPDVANKAGNAIEGGLNVIKDGFDTFGNDLSTGFGVVGNFIANHKDAFIQGAVTIGLMAVFPEFAPEIAMTGLQNLLPMIIQQQPAGTTGVPTQADIDAALAKYKADPRYNAMYARLKTFIANFNQWAKYDSPTDVMGIYNNQPTRMVWAHPNSVNMGGGGDGVVQINYLLHYQGDGGDAFSNNDGYYQCCPIQMIMKGNANDLMNYIIPVANSPLCNGYTNPVVYLNADGSNYRDSLQVKGANYLMPYNLVHQRGN